jgi:F-type H+-transporting ATPase subunit b
MNGLGIDWKILLGQIINFVVLLWLLKKFVYKPFLAMLQKRQAQIEEGAAKAQEAENSLQKIKSLAKEVADAQDKRSKELIAIAEIRAKEKAKEILASAEIEKQKIAEIAARGIEQEHLRLHEQHQKEAVDMAFVVAEKFLKEKITKEADKKLIERFAQEIK